MHCVSLDINQVIIAFIKILYHSGGVDVPFQHLETFIPLAEVSKVCMSTQNGVLRDIARCFTNSDLDIPLREKLYSFVKFKKISKYE